MPGLHLSDVITWDGFESSVLTVFREALVRLAKEPTLTQSEGYINLKLYRLALNVAWEKRKSSPGEILPFGILVESSSQPTADDVARSERLTKRPDITCQLVNAQSAAPEEMQLCYYLECKRLGQRIKSWVLNENYSEHGIKRFVAPGWEYAKGCRTGTMIGYMESMAPADILTEVNAGVTSRQLPLLSMAAQQWAAGSINLLQQGALIRGCTPTEFSLGHVWVDLRHCQFVSAPPVRKKGKRAAKKPKDAKKLP